MDRIWMTPPFGEGEPKEVDATPEVLTPLCSASSIIPIGAAASRSAGAGT